MTRPVEIGQPDLFWLLLGYTRYAVGRMSVAPSIAQEMVQKYARGLEPHQLQQIAREVQRDLDVCNEHREQSLAQGRELKSGRDWLGMDFDHKGWEKFVEWCRREAEGPHEF